MYQALFAAGVIIWVYAMMSTRYRVVDGVLHVHHGPFHRRIELESISTISLGEKLRWARLYGLGSDRLGIDYEGGRAVNITPKDVDGFLAAIGACRTESGDFEIAVSTPDSQTGT